jgi:hypothetical protein
MKKMKKWEILQLLINFIKFFFWSKNSFWEQKKIFAKKVKNAKNVQLYPKYFFFFEKINSDAKKWDFGKNRSKFFFFDILAWTNKFFQKKKSRSKVKFKNYDPRIVCQSWKKLTPVNNRGGLAPQKCRVRGDGFQKMSYQHVGIKISWKRVKSGTRTKWAYEKFFFWWWVKVYDRGAERRNT